MLAIDKRTNDVYYFGEVVDIYKDRKVVDHEGGWLSGAKFGMMMPGHRLAANFIRNSPPRWRWIAVRSLPLKSNSRRCGEQFEVPHRKATR